MIEYDDYDEDSEFDALSIKELRELIETPRAEIDAFKAAEAARPILGTMTVELPTSAVYAKALKLPHGIEVVMQCIPGSNVAHVVVFGPKA